MCDPEENWDEPNLFQGNKNNKNYNGSNGFENKNKSFERQRGGRNMQDSNCVEFLNITQGDIGSIIGRGGSNIKRVEEDFQVRLNVDKERLTVKISSENEKNVIDALQHLKDNIQATQERGARYNKQNYSASGRDSSDYCGGRDSSDYRGGRGSSDYRGGGQERSSYGQNRQFDNFKHNKGSNWHNNDENNFYESNENDCSNYQTYASNPAPEEDATEQIIIDWDAINLRSEIERKKRWASCPELTKNFYKEHPEVANLSKDEAERIRAENNNTQISRVFKDATEDSSTDDIPNPVWKFEHCFEPYPDLLEEIRKQGFQTPSPIQAQAWPVLLKGEDLIGIAQTGTGKTLAFLLPAMIHTEYQSIPRSERGGPNVLVMAPTRELALQIEKEVNKYSFRGMRAVCVYGGGNRRDQIQDVEKGAEIIICTPGRLNDLIQAYVINVSTITYLVLDEADRMLDMGFEPQIRKIMLDIRPDRQTVMTSATWPPGVRRLAQSYMNNPIQICVGTLDLAATHTVTQVVEIMEDDEKYHRIKSFVRSMQSDEKVIIFCGRKTRADDLSSDFTLEGELCQCIHGSRDQADREQAIADITSGEVKILIATDVASRGLDIEDITHVINFDFPRNIEEYVHRVGRTGRAGRNGVSISYLTREDWAMAQPLIDILMEAGQEVSEELLKMAERFKAMKDRRANELSKIGDFGGKRGGGGRGGGRFQRGRNRY